jgi:epoxyqueuosine reductase
MKPLLNLSTEQLQALGIVDWGYTEELKAQSFHQFENWTQENQELTYLTDHRKFLRQDLRLIDSKIESSLVFLFSYASTQKSLLENKQHQVAGYALGFDGSDYHWILKEKLLNLSSLLNLECKISLDIEPILERDLAYRAGLGWFGKNSMLISQKEGSYFMLGSLLLFKKLPLDSPILDTDHCGHCELCVEACPTDAINPETRTLVLNRCLSTFTIEMRKETNPPLGLENSRGEIFGCDICQDVCPWNKKKLQNTMALPLSTKAKELLCFFSRPYGKILEEIESWSQRQYLRFFKGTPIDRPGLRGMKKNLKAQSHVLKN